jgi:glycosyltransferase involved in cell wall biosynthesis
MASGKPIVASNIPAIREVLTDGHNAVLVEPGDGEALGRGIKRVINDQVFAGKIARRAFDEAINYSWSQRANQVMDLLTTVVLDHDRQN